LEGEKECEFWGFSREEENQSFGVSLSLFRGVILEIKVSYGFAAVGS